MKPPPTEFHRPLQVDRVPKLGSTEKLAADAKELAALATRMQLPALHELRAEIRATPWRGGGMKLEGGLVADVEQVSVISLEPFRQTVTLPIVRYFLPAGSVAPETEEDDADPIQHGSIDLGEVVAETLALELDPYPRKPGETFAAHVESDEAEPQKESPFAALAKQPKDS